MLYVLLDKLPLDIILYIKKKFLISNKRCKICNKSINYNTKIYKEINKWTFCSLECYNFI